MIGKKVVGSPQRRGPGGIQLLAHSLQAQCNYSCLRPTCIASTFDCRPMLSVEHACVLSLQAYPTRKLNCRHACSKSCHLSAPPWGCMMVMSIIIIMQCSAMQRNSMQCNAMPCYTMQWQAYLHWWASMLSSTIMMQTPLRSLPLLPARPLI